MTQLQWAWWPRSSVKRKMFAVWHCWSSYWFLYWLQLHQVNYYLLNKVFVCVCVCVCVSGRDNPMSFQGLTLWKSVSCIFFLPKWSAQVMWRGPTEMGKRLFARNSAGIAYFYFWRWKSKYSYRAVFQAAAAAHLCVIWWTFCTHLRWVCLVRA